MTAVLQMISIGAIPIVLAITLHEAAHAYAAKRFGDATAYMLGRVTLNPIKHIDPVGTVAIPLISLLLGGILFGWAKPVPVNFGRLRRPKQDMLWVAAAGPFANLIMLVLWAIVVKLSLILGSNAYAAPMQLMGEFGMRINAVLMVLNLLPLPPLDGGRIAVSLLPTSLAMPLARIEPYGMIVLVVLLFSGILGQIIFPFINLSMRAVGALIGI